MLRTLSLAVWVFSMTVACGLVVGCSSESDAAAAEPPEPLGWVASCEPAPYPGIETPPFTPPLDCRSAGETWIEGTPLRLPCEPTLEPCDLVDNDSDGITDPHCPTFSCRSDGDCTYGGLLADADCNNWGDTGPECNQIDGAPADAPTHRCWGMLCPPGLKCFSGECIVAGTKAPGEPCASGTECPIHAGCIPDTPGDDVTAQCRYVCDDWACPSGYACVPRAGEAGNGTIVTHRTCSDPFLCDAAREDCGLMVNDCARFESCSEKSFCLIRCRLLGGFLCDSQCEIEPEACSLPSLAATCQIVMCPGLVVPGSEP